MTEQSPQEPNGGRNEVLNDLIERSVEIGELASLLFRAADELSENLDNLSENFDSKVALELQYSYKALARLCNGMESSLDNIY